MSRNFELLRRAGKDRRLFAQPSENSSPKDPRRYANDVDRHFREETVKLVQRLFLFPNSHAPRKVVFSSVQGNGSSEICARAGEVLSNHGSVCLVDANVRAPSLHRLLGTRELPGLMDALVRPGPVKDFAVQIAGGNLWVLPPGSFGAQPESLFASEQLRSRIGELREEFDYVVIDAPAVGSCADAALIGQMADGVILVVEANSTRRETARIAKETLEGANAKLLGVVLNNRTFPIPETLYRKL
jgi:capsular exopolysaccharide synthesis family protein